MSDDDNARQPFPIFTSLVFPQLFCALIVALRVPLFIRLSFLLATLAFDVHIALSEAYTTRDPLQDYALGCTLASQWFTYCYMLLVLGQPLDKVRHDEDIEHPAHKSLLQRVYWSLAHIVWPRSVGFSDQVKNVPPPSTRSRWNFVFTRLFRIAEYVLIIDVCQAYMHIPAIVRGPNGPPLSTWPYIHRCLFILAYGIHTYATICAQYDFIAAICVATGVSKAKYWPKLFGNWSDAYTVRNLWGKTWHQMLRRMFATFAKLYVNWLGIQPGSLLSSNLQLIIVFTFSGIMHACGDALSGLQYTGNSFFFFFSQAFTIMFEDQVIALFKRFTGVKGSPLWARLVGYVWVWTWFSLTLPWLIGWIVQAGFGEEAPLKLGLFEPVVQWVVDGVGIKTS